MATLCLVQRCPVFNDIGPYISIITTDGKATLDSAYRGSRGNAEVLLNKYGHHSQRQLSEANAAERAAWGIMGTPNLPGFSTHELFSDGAAYPFITRGSALQWWMQGFDVNEEDCDRVIHEAATHGWEVWRPYDSAAELHHLNFKKKPTPGPKTIARIFRLRQTLPRT